MTFTECINILNTNYFPLIEGAPVPDQDPGCSPQIHSIIEIGNMTIVPPLTHPDGVHHLEHWLLWLS